MRKQNGAYYTPEHLANWLANYVKGSIPKNNAVNVLEAGCGDGAFLRALNKTSKKHPFTIDAVDLDKEAINKAQKSHYTNIVNLINEDFLFWDAQKKYDLVIGNPPYVVKKRLTEQQAVACKKIHTSNGLKDIEVANLWTAFVVKSISFLSDKGTAAFVLPNEILQVKYAEEIRVFLLEKFKRIEVVSFKKLAFSSIEQDTVLLICYSSTNEKSGAYFTEVHSVEELQDSLFFTAISFPRSIKWTANILSEGDLTLLQKISEDCKKAQDYCSSTAGIVTAANSYFIVSSSTVEKYSLHLYVKSIIQKGIHVNGSMDLSLSQYKNIQDQDTPCWLIDLTNVCESTFSKGLKSYLSEGIAESINERYKCVRRNRWFDVPSVWKSEGFFFKRSYQYPKLLTNSADVYVTDSAYRIRMLEHYTIESLSFSFYNSLTLAMAEIYGRYYGGGVLELTPHEFKSLPIPYMEIGKREFKKQTLCFEEKKSIEDVLFANDDILLKNQYGLKQGNIERIQNIYQKLKSRRIRG